MGEYFKHSEDSNLPQWLKESLSSKCSCGYDMLNYYNDKGECTNRLCSNKVCPNMVAKRLQYCVEVLGLKGSGIGYKTCLKVSDNIKLSHMEVLPKLIGKKPRVTLSTYLRLLCLGGMDTGASEVGGSISSIDELYTKYDGKYKFILLDNKEIVTKCVEYVELVASRKYEKDAVLVGNVMMTGDIHGWAKREDFIRAINIMYKGLVRLSVVDKRKTGVMALIHEDGAKITGKISVARSNNIPEYNPTRFMEFIVKTLIDKGVDLEGFEYGE